MKKTSIKLSLLVGLALFTHLATRSILARRDEPGSSKSRRGKQVPKAITETATVSVVHPANGDAMPVQVPLTPASFRAGITPGVKAMSQLGPRHFAPEGNGIGIHGIVLLHDSNKEDRFLWVTKIMSPDESVVYFEKFYEAQIFSIDDVEDNTVRFDDVIPFQNGDYKAMFSLVKIRPKEKGKDFREVMSNPGNLQASANGRVHVGPN